MGIISFEYLCACVELELSLSARCAGSFWETYPRNSSTTDFSFRSSQQFFIGFFPWILNTPVYIRYNLQATSCLTVKLEATPTRCWCPAGSPCKCVGCCWILSETFFPEIFVTPMSWKMSNHTNTWGHQIATIMEKIWKIPNYRRDTAGQKMMQTTNA